MDRRELWPILALALALALTGLSCTDPVATQAPEPAKMACFTAVGDGSQPAQGVFEALGRSGNGETWHAILWQALSERATIGPATMVDEMAFGSQREVVYDGRKSWIGFDVEAGGAVFCTPDQGLLAALRTIDEQARRDPDLLRKLIAAVPAGSWDD